MVYQFEQIRVKGIDIPFVFLNYSFVALLQIFYFCFSLVETLIKSSLQTFIEDLDLNKLFLRAISLKEQFLDGKFIKDAS
jgi:hypothetical protein